MLCLVGWSTVAILGLHVPAWLAAVPWLQLGALAAATVALVGVVGVMGRDATTATQDVP